MNKVLYILIMFVAATFSMSAQNRTITGKVLDGDFNNEPLIGAAIRMEFSSKNHPAAGTVSDIDGNLLADHFSKISWKVIFADETSNGFLLYSASI